MSRLREDLERELLSNPFNAELRTEYAQVCWTTAIRKPRSSSLSCSTRSRPPMRRPRSARHLRSCAWDATAKRCNATQPRATLPGLSQTLPLESRLEKAKPAAPARFTVVQGGRSDKVVNFAPPQGRERIGFADIAGLDDLKRTVRLQIIEPFLKPGIFAKFKKQAGGGVLLYGPPGCGKTMIARALRRNARPSSCRSVSPTYSACGSAKASATWPACSTRHDTASRVFCSLTRSTPWRTRAPRRNPSIPVRLSMSSWHSSMASAPTTRAC